MNSKCELDSGWMGWFEVMKKVAALMRKEDFTAALSELEAFLAHEENRELRSDALGFRADIRERVGDLGGAIEDLLVARSLVGPGYQRYVHELVLGTLSERRSLREDACFWYRTALSTCLLDNGISGGTVLERFFHLCAPANLSPADADLCKRVVEHSWRTLRLPRKPDADLGRALSKILDAQGRAPEANAE